MLILQIFLSLTENNNKTKKKKTVIEVQFLSEKNRIRCCCVHIKLSSFSSYNTGAGLIEHKAIGFHTCLHSTHLAHANGTYSCRAAGLNEKALAGDQYYWSAWATAVSRANWSITTDGFGLMKHDWCFCHNHDCWGDRTCACVYVCMCPGVCDIHIYTSVACVCICVQRSLEYVFY